MIGTPPKLVLPPEGMRWGRWAHQQITAAHSRIDQATTNMSSAVSTQNGTLRKLAGQIQTLRDQQEQLTTVVSHLGNLVRSSTMNTSGFSWSGSGTWNSVSTPIAVPAGAQKVDLFYAVEAVFCANSSLGSAVNTYVACSCPAVGDGTATAPAFAGPDVIVQPNQQQQRVRNYILSQQSVVGIPTLNFYAFGAADNSGSNANNYLKIIAQAIFSF